MQIPKALVCGGRVPIPMFCTLPSMDGLQGRDPTFRNLGFESEGAVAWGVSPAQRVQGPDGPAQVTFFEGCPERRAPEGNQVVRSFLGANSRQARGEPGMVR